MLEGIKTFVDTAAVADLTAAETLIEAKLTPRRETVYCLKTRPHIGVSDDPQQRSARRIVFWWWSQHNRSHDARMPCSKTRK